MADLRLVVAGEGPERAGLEASARELGIASRVHFIGAIARARLAQLLRDALVFAFPSRGEAFGIALLEAMAAGAPAVATHIGGIPEFASNERNALLVPSDDPAALARALARLASDEPLRERLALEARKTAAELTWTRVTDQYEETYIRALQTRGG
jgi:glycosyltransferase involved in cell wall biosynthesis